MRNPTFPMKFVDGKCHRCGRGTWKKLFLLLEPGLGRFLLGSRPLQSKPESENARASSQARNLNSALTLLSPANTSHCQLSNIQEPATCAVLKLCAELLTSCPFASCPRPPACQEPCSSCAHACHAGSIAQSRVAARAHIRKTCHPIHSNYRVGDERESAAPPCCRAQRGWRLRGWPARPLQETAKQSPGLLYRFTLFKSLHP